MSIERLGGTLPGDERTSEIALPERARLYMIRGGEIPEDQRDTMRTIGAEFLHELVGERSFRARFGAPKPNTERLRRLVDHFLDGSEHSHAMVLLMRHQRLLGACSIYDHPMRPVPGDDTVDRTHVAEFSVTIADEYQGQGLGKLLLTHAGQQAIAAGRTHAYCSFEAGNEPSRRMVSSVFGSDNIVAGATNPRDKYYRLVPYSDQFAEIEHAMQLYCGDRTQPDILPDQAHVIYLPATLARHRFGRRIIEAIDVALPDTIQVRVDD